VVPCSPARVGSLDFPLYLVGLTPGFEVIGRFCSDAIRGAERSRSPRFVI
jgi:hypothetical protein